MNVNLFLKELTELSRKYKIGLFVDCESEEIKLFDITNDHIINNDKKVYWDEDKKQYVSDNDMFARQVVWDQID